MRAMSWRVKKALLPVFGTAMAILFFISVLPAQAGPPPKKKAPPSGQQLYGNVWRKCRPNPKARPRGTASAVAGLRGDEKGKFLRPYWKGEKKKESPDIAAFRKAGKLMDASEFAKAEKAFLKFVAKFPKSPLLPKVKIGLAICYIQLEKKEDAGKLLTQWLKDYPQNELAPDVKAILADLKK